MLSVGPSEVQPDASTAEQWTVLECACAALAHSARAQHGLTLLFVRAATAAQHVGWTRTGDILPCLTQKMTIWSHGKQRLATPHELMLSHGLPAFESGPKVGLARMGLAYSRAFDDLRHGQQQSVLGNGMHLAAMASWIFYCLSNTVLKSDMIDALHFEASCAA